MEEVELDHRYPSAVLGPLMSLVNRGWPCRCAATTSKYVEVEQSDMRPLSLSRCIAI